MFLRRLLCRLGVHRMSIRWERKELFFGCCDVCGRQGVFRR